MSGQRLCRQKEGDCRPVRLQKTLATQRASQELLARVCENLLVRRLTVKEGTVLLEARDWPGKDRELAAGLKIRCSDRTEVNEGAVMSSSVPASSAGKK
ncbi:hypothetical protein BDFG_05764 [Blastomyces dermatitidis ATCC 26199]|nr:hypothetical protein BDFG_05764 [Blastomyces dermatitidis ATCC 26199]